jgi:flagella basal body P-ring formation protein FlgA
MLRSSVVVLRADVSRGDVLHEEDLFSEHRWITPIQASTLCGFVEAVGRVAGMPLKAGDLLRKKHVKRDVLVKRGDRVIVRCLVGGVVISLDAEARSDGAEGDPVELRKLGERNTFMAMVSGPGAAILDLAH